jgi:hypothetical protein
LRKGGAVNLHSSKWSTLQQATDTATLLQKLGDGESPQVGLQRALKALGMIRKIKPPSEAGDAMMDQGCQTESPVRAVDVNAIDKSEMLAICDNVYEFCGEAVHTLNAKGVGRNGGSAEALAVVNSYRQYKQRQWPAGDAKKFVGAALHALMQTLEGISIASPSAHIRYVRLHT